MRKKVASQNGGPSDMAPNFYQSGPTKKKAPLWRRLTRGDQSMKISPHAACFRELDKEGVWRFPR